MVWVVIPVVMPALHAAGRRSAGGTKRVTRARTLGMGARGHHAPGCCQALSAGWRHAGRTRIDPLQKLLSGAGAAVASPTAPRQRVHRRGGRVKWADLPRCQIDRRRAAEWCSRSTILSAILDSSDAISATIVRSIMPSAASMGFMRRTLENHLCGLVFATTKTVCGCTAVARRSVARFVIFYRAAPGIGQWAPSTGYRRLRKARGPAVRAPCAHVNAADCPQAAVAVAADRWWAIVDRWSAWWA